MQQLCSETAFDVLLAYLCRHHAKPVARDAELLKAAVAIGGEILAVATALLWQRPPETPPVTALATGLVRAVAKPREFGLQGRERARQLRPRRFRRFERQGKERADKDSPRPCLQEMIGSHFSWYQRTKLSMAYPVGSAAYNIW